MKLLAKFSSLVGYFFGQIDFFADVAAEVVKRNAVVFVELNQPQIAGADRAIRAVAPRVIMRIVPLQVAFDGGIRVLKQRRDAGAVN